MKMLSTRRLKNIRGMTEALAYFFSSTFQVCEPLIGKIFGYPTPLGLIVTAMGKTSTPASNAL